MTRPRMTDQPRDVGMEVARIERVKQFVQRLRIDDGTEMVVAILTLLDRETDAAVKGKDEEIERIHGTYFAQHNDRMREAAAEIGRLMARIAAAEGERDGLRHLIETGHSRGAVISPSIRRIFSAGSKAAAERDALMLEIKVLKAERDEWRMLHAHATLLAIERAEEIECLKTAVEQARAALRDAPDMTCESPEARAWRAKHSAALTSATGGV